MAWDQHIASREIIKTHKVLSRNLKEKYQFRYKDLDGRATLKLKHTHITAGKTRETEVIQYSHQGPGVVMKIFRGTPLYR